MASIGTPTAQISRAASRGVGRILPSLKTENDVTTPPLVPNGKAKSPRSSRAHSPNVPRLCQLKVGETPSGIAYTSAVQFVSATSRHPCAISSTVTFGRARSPSAPPLLIFSPPNKIHTESNPINTPFSNHERERQAHAATLRAERYSHAPTTPTAIAASADRQIHISPLFNASMSP